VVPRWKAPWVQPTALFFAEERSKRPSAGGPAQAGPSGGELRESRLAGSGASAPKPRWARKRIMGARGFVSAHPGARLERQTHDRKRRPLQPAGPRAHDTRCQRHVGLGSAPLRREKSRRTALGEAKASRPSPWSHKPLLRRLARGDRTRIRRRARATSPLRGSPHGTGKRASASSQHDAPPGFVRSQAVLADRVFIAVLASIVPGFGPSGSRSPRPAKARRCNGPLARASSLRKRGDRLDEAARAASGLGPSRVRGGG
jgi:hypothetical protein